MSTVPALWTKYRSLADGIASEYRLPGAEPQDARQEARVALWEACRAYDKTRGSFPAFARTVIHRHLTDCLRKATRNKQMVLTEASRVPRDHEGGYDWAAVRDLIDGYHDTIFALAPAQREAVRAFVNGERLTRAQHSSLYKARRKLRAAA